MAEQTAVSRFEAIFLKFAEEKQLDVKASLDENFPLDQHDLKRFLVARQNNEQAAAEMLHNTLVWRTKTKPVEITEEEIIEYLKSGEVFFGPFDLEGNEVVYVPVHLHTNWGNPQRDSDYQKVCLFLMETGIRRARHRDSPEARATMVLYLAKFGMSNMDFNYTQFLTACFANYYPETLSHILIVDAPWIFSTCWPLIKGWIDPNTAKKIAFISTGELTKYISSDNIPTEYGGSWKWKYETLTPKK